MKKPHINLTSAPKPQEAGSIASMQVTAKSDRVSHGLRIFGQLTVQDANRAALMIGLQDDELDESGSPGLVNEAAESPTDSRSFNSSSLDNVSYIKNGLAANNLKAIKSIDALLSQQTEQIVFPKNDLLFGTTFDCSIQSMVTENASVFGEVAQIASRTQAIHTEPSSKHLRHDLPHSGDEADVKMSLVTDGDVPTAPKLEKDALKYHPEVRRAVDHLAKQLVKGKSRVWQFHALTAPEHEEAVTQIWPLAFCWANVRSESLLVIDATRHGQSLASAWGWQDDIGLQDILFDEKLPSAALRRTHFDKLTFLSRGITRADDYADWSSDAEHQLRLKSLLMALQRDFAAIWVVTSEDWNAFSQTISESAHKRELVIPMSSTNTAQIWRASVNKLIQQNVLINGWLALGNSETKQLSA